ncbi:MAG: hypothetical protein F4X14_20120 [Caldilineaceae bacterium SB0661_bin_32]|uniref:Uncharacterized protein n=1 Tax=Caldilineaceae bacterium SB0661_bin_32 TaxID=2605255 RepID=A0A6B1DB38_9CHLR|nr:hypothetical protein [Chloroflexota bacterium]MYC97270.1 hypothetical protein [Caldilineaceae bacterium SB0661_bin_32]
MKGKLSQPVLFNLITIAAMLFSLFQLVAVSQRTATSEVIDLFEALAAEGVVEDETLSVRLAAEREQRLRLANYILATLLFAILANVVANYLGRGRHFENTARIRELEAEIRGLRGR